MIECINILFLNRSLETMPHADVKKLEFWLSSPPHLDQVQNFVTRIWDHSLTDDHYDFERAMHLLLRKVSKQVVIE